MDMVHDHVRNHIISWNCPLPPAPLGQGSSRASHEIIPDCQSAFHPATRRLFSSRAPSPTGNGKYSVWGSIRKGDVHRAPTLARIIGTATSPPHPPHQNVAIGSRITREPLATAPLASPLATPLASS